MADFRRLAQSHGLTLLTISRTAEEKLLRFAPEMRSLMRRVSMETAFSEIQKEGTTSVLMMNGDLAEFHLADSCLLRNRPIPEAGFFLPVTLSSMPQLPPLIRFTRV